ncbi:hypothetical protein GEV33_014888 [Tenebrio molitor]|uniref:Uncharacterized protein n=1 Tax=Tenebrio molitor TaxID=7067 RepID=A0A8J6H5Y9_TENMO|nr:hypothetical protein GEV33_014889 [Tenebrio molitor]KAH0807903.1 hypothetical protein GEV33_014888 [Tenebrio molitor]
MNSGDEIRGQTATTRSHTRGHESIRLSIFNPEEENASDWITDNERAKKMYGWDEYETLHRVSPYLVGEALEWFKRRAASRVQRWSMYLVRGTLEDPACLKHDDAEIQGVCTTAAVVWSKTFQQLSVEWFGSKRNTTQQEDHARRNLVALKRVVNRRHKLALRCKGPYEVVRSKVAWEVPFEPDLTLVEVYLSRDGAP